jgi:hypothetical protein
LKIQQDLIVRLLIFSVSAQAKLNPGVNPLKTPDRLVGSLLERIRLF